MNRTNLNRLLSALLQADGQPVSVEYLSEVSGYSLRSLPVAMTFLRREIRETCSCFGVPERKVKACKDLPSRDGFRSGRGWKLV